jgi:hypothetical protein
MTRKAIFWAITIALAALVLTTCTDSDSPVEPSAPATAIAGVARFPAGNTVDLSEVTVTLGTSSVPIAPDGSFSLTARAGAPAFVMASGPDTLPMLVAVLPRPEAADQLELNARSSALALAMLSPWVCSSTAEYAEYSRSILETLPELTQLEELLAARLATDPTALGLEDEAIDEALGSLVTAYLNALPSVQIPGGLEKPSTTSGEIIISPDWVVGGHQLSYVQTDRFAITNWYGRWAYCAAPQDSFYLFPNGTLLDILKGSKPWAASRREFSMPLPTAQQSRQVNVFGFGWSPATSNAWDSLSSQEQTLAMYGGLSTIMLEFVPHLISVLSNTGKLTGLQTLPKTEVVILSTWILKQSRVADRIREYAKAKNFSGAMWFTTKQYISAIVNDTEFRNRCMSLLGITLTEGMIRTLAGWLHLGAKAVLTFDAIASTAKTFFGATGSRFKTSFDVSWEETEFGTIAGTIHDKSTGRPLSGVLVKLKGDEGNPLNPAHEATTGSSGGFYFENITVGAKTLEASKAGYGSTSKEVIVEQNTTVTVTMELSEVKGRLTGSVMNDIFIQHGISPSTFRGESHLEIEPVGTEDPGTSYWISNGSYALDLPGGTYRVVAWHEDYVADTISVTVQPDGATVAPDLILRPDGFVRGSIYLDMDNNGSYEQQYQISQSLVGGGWRDDAGTCPGSITPHRLLFIGSTGLGTTQDGIAIVVNPLAVHDAGFYTLGGLDAVHCSTTIPAAVGLVTLREQCTYPPTGQMAPMAFLLHGDESFLPCNCGVSSPGNLVLESYDTTLTGVLKGSTIAEMAGSTECSCYPDSVSGCARAYVDLEFKVLMGSLPPENSRDRLGRYLGW